MSKLHELFRKLVPLKHKIIVYQWMKHGSLRDRYSMYCPKEDRKNEDTGVQPLTLCTLCGEKLKNVRIVRINAQST